ATALRQKAKSVHQFGKHPKLPPARTNDNQWPEQPHVFTLEYAYEEAEAKFGRDPREYSIQTTKMVADKNGKLKELHTIQMEKVKNEHGKYEFRELP
ncbi:glutamate synthase, partial [Staphylococcus epidermidis]